MALTCINYLRLRKINKIKEILSVFNCCEPLNNILVLLPNLPNYLFRVIDFTTFCLFYEQEQEHLKPQIVHNLANAELYCLAFANIYSDPNYHNLNHCGILQTLSRKGVAIPDPPDGLLTETVLIQTTPLKMVSS